MDFLRELKYAYSPSGEIISIDCASKRPYFLDKEQSIELIYIESYKRKNGISVSSHFKRRYDSDSPQIKDFIGGESIEHLNAKRAIVEAKAIKINDTIIQGAKAIEEVRFPETGNIIDVVLYDNLNEPILGVEIYHTHKKSNEDIDKLTTLKIPVYEIDINEEGRGNFLCTGDGADEHRTPIKKRIRDASNRKSELEVNNQRCKLLREEIEGIEEQLRLLRVGGTSALTRRIREQYIRYEKRVENARDGLEPIRRRLKEYREREQELRGKITVVEQQIKRYEKGYQRLVELGYR
jgi:hypothetical protein